MLKEVISFKAANCIFRSQETEPSRFRSKIIKLPQKGTLIRKVERFFNFCFFFFLRKQVFRHLLYSRSQSITNDKKLGIRGGKIASSEIFLREKRIFTKCKYSYY